ncbi:MAG: anthranilate phosphoribosyltransferase [Bacillota bacterium]|nr:anthranilate phosphoribosyltransferase [Bacillota bacterium]
MSLAVLNKNLQKVIAGVNLSFDEANDTMLDLMSGEASDAEIGAFLAALKAKGETIDEISGLANGMREKAVKINTNHESVIDIVGTGGDKAGTFNISSTSAFVIAGAGIAVAKHGNRSISSKSGAADVLEALGININGEISQIESQLNNIGITFLFAPKVNLSMKYVMKARKDLGIPTVFNVLGPLTNPVKLSGQVLGVYKDDLVLPMAKSLQKLGIKKAVVVYGAGGLDEASLSGDNHVAIVNGDVITEQKINSKDLGLLSVPNTELIGGTPAENAEITLAILKGEKGAKRDAVLLNSALGILAADRAEDIKEAIEIAKESIDSGKALEKLQQYINISK